MLFVDPPWNKDFYPRSPHGERPRDLHLYTAKWKFLSTLSAWRATALLCLLFAARNISIHALRMESDYMVSGFFYSVIHFYPRSPHGERLDLDDLDENNTGISIHALRMESDNIYDYLQEMLDSISIHALRMESDRNILRLYNTKNISIHALRMESDWNTSKIFFAIWISIHALRMESDGRVVAEIVLDSQFLSTLSAWRATSLAVVPTQDPLHFYPRSPHGERRCHRCTGRCTRAHFYPRSPHGERPKA